MMGVLYVYGEHSISSHKAASSGQPCQSALDKMIEKNEFTYLNNKHQPPSTFQIK